jgi:hypothetical protein
VTVQYLRDVSEGEFSFELFVEGDGVLLDAE